LTQADRALLAGVQPDAAPAGVEKIVLGETRDGAALAS
jgi:hypothetical protein